jgi:hypothetical protein
MKKQQIGAALILLAASPAAAQPATPTEAAPEASATTEAALQANAAYGATIMPLINEGLALLGEITDLSGRYLLGFTAPETYAGERDAIAAALAAIGARIKRLQDATAALAEPPSGPYAERGAELLAYSRKFAADVGEAKAALDRLPALVESGDADGFDAARADIFRFSSSTVRAENAMLTANQLYAPLGQPEYHLIEAIKNGNVVIADLIDLMQLANADQREGLDAIANRIAAHHRGIGVSLDAAAALADTLERQVAALSPAQKEGLAALAQSYRTAIAIERRIGEGLADYAPIARAIAAGEEPAAFKARLDKVGALVGPLVAERQAALAAKQQAAIALAGKS